MQSQEDRRMNTDIVDGKWKQMRGQMKEWWGQLTDDDFDVIAGKRDKLDAENEVARRFREMDEQLSSHQPSGTYKP
jgi:uncharacterized protein YjbJ (UPF0337 family)